MHSNPMPRISALIHAHNDERRLARTLETLRPMDEIVVLDHGSTDGTVRIAREYGARVVMATPERTKEDYAGECANEWIFVIKPDEALSEGLEASLYDFAAASPTGEKAYWVLVREQSSAGWQSAAQEVRLFRKQPPQGESKPASGMLAGDLLRYQSVH